MEEFLFSLLEISEQSDEERTWASDSAIDKERFRSMRHCVPEKINQHIHAAQNKDPGFTNSLWICQGRPINMKIITISIRKPSVSAKSEERSADIFLKTASMSTFFQKTTGNLRGQQTPPPA